MPYLIGSIFDRFLRVLHADRRAAGALEYALLVSFIAVAVIVGVTKFGTALGTFFSAVGTDIAGWGT
nr:Flp family type IVb pilin [uncultured Rhodopila sp.]